MNLKRSRSSQRRQSSSASFINNKNNRNNNSNNNNVRSTLSNNQASMAFNEDSSASGHDEPWIQWFCGLKGHEMFCEVERSYIEDGFNLYGLRACVSNFSDCLDLILDRIGPDDSDDSHLTQSACTLYGLIHARYIITAHGLDAMYNKYAAKEFGTCPLVQCSGQPVLPVGIKDETGADTVKIFCPKCKQVYHTPPLRSRANMSTGVDGAAFGTTFPHLFLMTFSNLVPDPLPAGINYIPRVFGFRVHQSTQRALPLPEATTNPPISNSKLTDSLNNNNNNNNTAAKSNSNIVINNNNNAVANQRDLPEEEEDEKSPIQGDDSLGGGAVASNASTNGTLRSTSSRKPKRGRKEEKSPTATTATAAVAAAAVAATGTTTSVSGVGAAAPTASLSVGGNTTTAVAPTFLMENPAKRRRRGAGNA